MPREIYDLMNPYPQTSQQRPGEFVPMPYHPSQTPCRLARVQENKNEKKKQE